MNHHKFDALPMPPNDCYPFVNVTVLMSLHCLPDASSLSDWIADVVNYLHLQSV